MTLSSGLLGGLQAHRREIVRKIRQLGLLRTIQHGFHRILRELQFNRRSARARADSFDSKFGTDTAQRVSVGALDIPNSNLEHSNRYEPVFSDVFFEMVGTLPINHGEFAFLDLGAGKGKALLLASFFPFAEIIGVELSQVLTDIASKNILRFQDKDQRCHRIRTLRQDAASYEIPPRKLVVFLYDPFGKQVMNAVVSNLSNSLRTYARKVFVIYQHATHQNLWDEAKEFSLIKATNAFAIYESKAA